MEYCAPSALISVTTVAFGLNPAKEVSLFNYICNKNKIVVVHLLNELAGPQWSPERARKPKTLCDLI